MGWSFQIGRLYGIPIRIHVTFLLLLGFIALGGLSTGTGIGGLTGVIFVCALFACVVLHELGHSVVAIRYGVPVNSITLLPIGGVAAMERIPEEPRQELHIAIAGPLVNVGIFIVIGALFALLGHSLFGPPPLYGGAAGLGLFGLLHQLMWINLMLAGFNLLPAFPMDGGRILRAFLAERMDYVRATSTAASVGQALAFVMGFAGLFLNPWLILIAVFVYIGAGQEEQQVRLRRALRDVPVSAALITRFDALGAHDPLGRALELARAGFQHDFPVLDDGRLVGIVTHEDLLRGLQELGPERPVSEIMHTDVCYGTTGGSLQDLYDDVSQGKCHVVAIMSEGRLAGLVTPESVGRCLMQATGHPTIDRLRARLNP